MPQQDDAVSVFCAKNGLDKPKLIEEPVGTSGYRTKFVRRIGARRFLLEAHRGDTLVVTCLDRIGRDIIDILSTVKRLEALGIRLIIMDFMGAPIDTQTPMGNFILQIRSAFAEFESRMNAKRVEDNREYRRRIGKLQSNAPWGQVRVETATGTSFDWDEQQIRYLYEFARRVGNGETIRDVARDVVAKGWIDHRGQPWGSMPPKKTKRPVAKPGQLGHYYVALRQFHAYKKAGTLPPPWNQLAIDIPDPPQRRKPPVYLPCRRRKRGERQPLEKTREQWTALEWAEWYEKEKVFLD